MNILAIDAALPRAGVAVTGADGQVLARRFAPGRPGLIETLPGLVEECVREAAIQLQAVAVTIGPGSFTGLRTAIAVAQGYAAGSGVPLLGVPVAAAFQIGFPNLQRPLWVAIRARANKIFLLREDLTDAWLAEAWLAEAWADSAIPLTRQPVAVAGNAANEVAARLAAADGNVILTNARMINPAWVATAARTRHQSGAAPHPALPLYIDPPEAKLPAGGLRPQPV